MILSGYMAVLRDMYYVSGLFLRSKGKEANVA
jgi:hypothetical protein